MDNKRRGRRPSANTTHTIAKQSGTSVPAKTARIEKLRSAWKAVMREIVPVAEVGASIGKAVPILGAPVEGALEALAKVLKLLEGRCQNKEDIEKLRKKLENISQRLSTSIESPSEHFDTLESQLRWTHSELDRHLRTTTGTLRYDLVAQAITKCDQDINFFLLEFLTFSQITRKKEVEDLKAEMKTEMKKNFDIMLQQITVLLPIMPSAIVIVDPYGRPHEFSKLPGTYSETAGLILDRYRRDPRKLQVLKEYIDVDMFEFRLDNDDPEESQDLTLSEAQLPYLRTGLMVYMSVVKYQAVSPSRSPYVECPCCDDRVQLEHKALISCPNTSCPGRIAIKIESGGSYPSICPYNPHLRSPHEQRQCPEKIVNFVVKIIPTAYFARGRNISIERLNLLLPLNAVFSWFTNSSTTTHIGEMNVTSISRGARYVEYDSSNDLIIDIGPKTNSELSRPFKVTMADLGRSASPKARSIACLDYPAACPLSGCPACPFFTPFPEHFGDGQSLSFESLSIDFPPAWTWSGPGIPVDEVFPGANYVSIKTLFCAKDVYEELPADLPYPNRQIGLFSQGSYITIETLKFLEFREQDGLECDASAVPSEEFGARILRPQTAPMA